MGNGMYSPLVEGRKVVGIYVTKAPFTIVVRWPDNKSYNPYKVVEHPGELDPSAGAIEGFDTQINTSYAMTYGQDPHPYGAVRQYEIGYQTYRPKLPGHSRRCNNGAPTVAPGVTPTGTTADYNFFYNRNTDINGGGVEQGRDVINAGSWGDFYTVVGDVE